MNKLCDLAAYLDTFRKVTGQDPDQQAVGFFASFCAAQNAIQRIGEEAHRQGVSIGIDKFKNAMPKDAHPEIIKSLYATFANGGNT